MISYIKGSILFTDESSVCILANNIGWDINVYSSIDYQLGSEYEMFVYTHQTEKSTSYWGLKSLEELNFFKMLITVSGVGPKTASTLIGEKGISNICNYINSGDFKSLKVKGLGETVSQKIILELKNKIPKSYINTGSDIPKSEALDNAMEALRTLGYSTSDISTSVIKIKDLDISKLNESELLKELLKSI